MSSMKTSAVVVTAALWAVACGTSGPVGPVVHEHQAVGYSARVDAGAGDTTIRLPAGVGISVRTSSLITDVNVSGLEQRDGRWVNPRANGSPVTVDVNVQHAIGDLRLVAE